MTTEADTSPISWHWTQTRSWGPGGESHNRNIATCLEWCGSCVLRSLRACLHRVWRNLEDDHTGQVRMVCSKQCLRHIVFYNSCISGAASNVSLLSSVTVLSISKSFSIIIVSLGFRSSCKTFLWSVTIDPTVELQPQGLLHPRDRFNILYASLVMASWQCPCQIVPSWPRPSPPSDCRARPSLPPRRPAVCLC